MHDHALEKISEQSRIRCHAVPETCFYSVGSDQKNFLSLFWVRFKCCKGEFSSETEACNGKFLNIILGKKNLDDVFPFLFFQRLLSTIPRAFAVEVQVKNIKCITTAQMQRYVFEHIHILPEAVENEQMFTAVASFGIMKRAVVVMNKLIADHV